LLSELSLFSVFPVDVDFKLSIFQVFASVLSILSVFSSFLVQIFVAQEFTSLTFVCQQLAKNKEITNK
jgi:hypothetical protein